MKKRYLLSSLVLIINYSVAQDALAPGWINQGFVEAWDLPGGDTLSANGSRTVIGGDAVINGHLFEKDGIHLSKVKIGSKVVIGTMAQINPGCVVGDGAVVASKAVLAKFTEVPAGEIWGGIPAKCIRRADGSKPE